VTLSPPITLHAATIAAPLARLRRAEAGGIVLAVFERSAYLDLDGGIAVLASADLPRGPLNITLREPGTLPAVAPRAPVALSNGMARLGNVAVDLAGAEVWNPALPRAPQGMTAGLRAAREVACAEVSTSAPEGSIAPLLSSATQAGPLLLPLSRGLAAIGALLEGREDPANVLPVIMRDVAGRGPGLTPSGDDLLAGIVLALSLWPGIAAAFDGGAPAAGDLLTNAARPRTTRISAAYLDAARQGHGAEPWHILVRSLQRTPEETRRAVRRLLRLGETSGADTLTGFCWAWRRAPG
jgi:hypothetical protein